MTSGGRAAVRRGHGSASVILQHDRVPHCRVPHFGGARARGRGVGCCWRNEARQYNVGHATKTNRLAGGVGVDGLTDLPRIAPADEQVELAESKSAVAGLATLVDAPGLDDVYPATYEVLVLARDEVEEAAAHTCRRRHQAVV